MLGEKEGILGNNYSDNLT